MTPIRFSIRGLMVTVAVIGFDTASLIQVGRFARSVHSGVEVVFGFGVILLFLNFVGFTLYRSFARSADLSTSSRLNLTPSPFVIFGLYAVVLAIAILFLTSGRF
jgi:hypothetical protein